MNYAMTPQETAATVIKQATEDFFNLLFCGMSQKHKQEEIAKTFRLWKEIEKETTTEMQ